MVLASGDVVGEDFACRSVQRNQADSVELGVAHPKPTTRRRSIPAILLPQQSVNSKQRNPHAYLKATLEAIADGHPASDIDRLLPWAFTPT